MDKLTIEIDAKQIYDGIQDLGSKMEEMITHQKETNGRVTKNEGKIGKLEIVHIKQAAVLGTILAVVEVVTRFI